MDNTTAFNLLRPICVQLTKEMTNDNVITLKELVKRIDSKSIQDMQEYILFPLRLILKANRSKEDFIVEVLNCISLIFGKTIIKNWDLFQNLHCDIVTLISHPKENGGIANRSEELKLAVVVCLSHIYENSDKEILKKLYQTEFFPQLGHLVFVLLRLAENESCRQLRIKSINCLMILSYGNKKDISITLQASSMFASFLPGISVSLAKIINGSAVQGHGVVVAALDAWAKIVCLVLGDSNLAKTKDLPENVSNNPKFPIINKNKVWLENTAMKLNILIENIVESVCQDHWAVQVALANWSGLLLLECNKSLEKSTAPLLDVLVTLSVNERPKVSKQSCELLRKVTNKFKESSELMNLVEENIHNLITKLPRVFHTLDDSKKISTLRSLIGYAQLLVLLDNTIYRLLLSPQQMNRLGSGLIHLIELDLTNTQLLTEQDNSCNLNETDPDHLKPVKKHFKNFQDLKIYSEWKTFCRLLGRFGDVTLLLDHCVDLYHNSKSHRTHSVMLMQELVIGAADENIKNKINSELWQFKSDNEQVFDEKKTDTDLNSIIKPLLDTFLEASVWRLPVNHSATYSDEITLEFVQSELKNKPSVSNELNANVWLICVMLEAIANFSQVLKSDFQPHLIRVLYPILDKLGSDSAIIVHSAHFAASIISNSVGCKSIAELIESNADYLVNSISLRLQHVDEHPEAPRILKSMFMNTGPEILPLVDDSINELFNSLDSFHSNSSELFMEVLNSLVSALLCWYPPEKTKQQESVNKPAVLDFGNDDKRDSSVSIQTIEDYFIEYHRLKREAEGEFEENGEDLQNEAYGNENEIEVDENKPESPNYVKLSVQALRRCVHFLPRTELRFGILVLDLIQSAVQVLQTHPDELLPLVHQIWTPFKLKFSDENLILIRKAYETLLVMTAACGDFITKRTLTDVWPKLTNYLFQQANTSIGKDTVTYKFTSAYKLQLSILSTLGDFINNFKFQEEQINEIVITCLPYLCKTQPLALQEAAIKTFELLVTLEPDIVWYHLLNLHEGGSQLIPNDKNLPVITVEEKCDHLEYEKNVRSIFDKIKTVKISSLL